VTGKRKGHRAGRIRAGYKKAAASLGKIAKAIVVMTPAVIVGFDVAVGTGGSIGNQIKAFLTGWSECYTGLIYRGPGYFEFHAEQLAIGWGPPLILAGINYGLKAVHQQGANPFRVMSTLG